jgi:uncharacterized membrane protein YdbT with pleckstrin-like domain
MTLDELINLAPGEKIVLKLRRHLLIFFGQFSLIFLLAFVPFGAGWIINSVQPEWFVITVGRTGLILLASAYYLNIWLFALAVFTDYYLDAWIVTNERVIDIQQTGLFARTVAELELQRIQDATSDVKGILPSVLGYGNVHIQTAGEKERFIFEQVPKPHEVRHALMTLVDKNRAEKPAIIKF